MTLLFDHAYTVPLTLPKQHRYLTLVVDHQARRVVWGIEGAGAATADAFFAELDPPPAGVPPDSQPAEIQPQRLQSPLLEPAPESTGRRVGERAGRLQAVSMDMGPGYAKSVREHAPQAVICIDPFHIVALANQALDEVRRDYWNQLRRLDDQQAAKRFKDARAGRCSNGPRI